ncbi:uncharacterized protein LOC142566802 [Dermacentor variabilis]|uniref:uncharacterized protein LOC142566802 n=1 Tax=Dermacentor variabilis TaxID=34621 RepID=UPI003F5B5599
MAQDHIVGTRSDAEMERAKETILNLKQKHTGCLLPTIILCLNFPYMITRNINATDELANGAMGTLRHIQKDVYGTPVRLWMQFANQKTGSVARLKLKHHRSHESAIDPTWVPIERVKFPCNLKGRGTNHIQLKRDQFPITTASAITIHKSQGGTFKYIVYDCSPKHPQALVYVALSRVTSLDGVPH